MIGMDDLDNKILRLLGKKPLYPSEISRKLEILRTTIQYRLNRLSHAGLARKIISGRKSIWQPVYKKDHNKNLCRIYRDKDIIKGYKQLFALPRHTLMLAVQGSGAVMGELNNLPPLFIKEAHRVFKRKDIAMKGIFNERSLELFEKVDKDMIHSHIGRPLGLKMLQGNTFLASGEVMSSETFLLLANPKSRFVLVIKDRGLTKVVYDALELLFKFIENHKTFDLNDYLKSKEKFSQKA